MHLFLEARRMSIPGKQNNLSKGPASGLKHRPCPQAEPTPGGLPPDTWYQASGPLQEKVPAGP